MNMFQCRVELAQGSQNIPTELGLESPCGDDSVNLDESNRLHKISQGQSMSKLSYIMGYGPDAYPQYWLNYII